MAFKEWPGMLVIAMCASLCAALSSTMPATRLPARSVPAFRDQVTKPSPSRAGGRERVLLAQAKEALGGSAALEEVTSLTLVRQDRTTERILFPDRWQSVLETPWGNAITTLDGAHWWSRSPKLPDQLVGLTDGARTSPTELIRSARRKIAACSLKYLLRPPSGDSMQSKYAGQVTFGGVTGEAVEFTASDGYWVLVVFDSSSGLPKAQVRKMGGSPEVHGTHLIEELRDYRPAGKILAPFQIATYRLRLGKIEALAVWRFTVEVNPPLKLSDFTEPKSDAPVK